MRVDAVIRPPRLFFTEPGLSNPADFAHVRPELSFDPPRQEDEAAARP